MILNKSKAEFPVKPNISEKSKTLIGLKAKKFLLLFPIFSVRLFSTFFPAIAPRPIAAEVVKIAALAAKVGAFLANCVPAANDAAIIALSPLLLAILRGFGFGLDVVFFWFSTIYKSFKCSTLLK